MLRLIHADQLPAIAVSDRIYRIPVASFEMFKAGTLLKADLAPLGRRKPRPQLGECERFPEPRSEALARHV